MKKTSKPNVLERLRAIYGNYAQIAKALGVDKSYITRWKRDCFIGEVWALDIEALRVRDGHGIITHMEVLIEAREGRRARAEAAP